MHVQSSTAFISTDLTPQDQSRNNMGKQLLAEPFPGTVIQGISQLLR